MTQVCLHHDRPKQHPHYSGGGLNPPGSRALASAPWRLRLGWAKPKILTGSHLQVDHRLRGGSSRSGAMHARQQVREGPRPCQFLAAKTRSVDRERNIFHKTKVFVWSRHVVCTNPKLNLTVTKRLLRKQIRINLFSPTRFCPAAFELHKHDMFSSLTVIKTCQRKALYLLH